MLTNNCSFKKNLISMIKAKVSVFELQIQKGKDTILFSGSVNFPLFVISTKLYFVEIGLVCQQLYIFKCTMLITLNLDLWTEKTP